MGIKNRLSASWKILEANRLGCFFISSKEDIFYYTGYKATDGDFLIIEKGRKPVLIVSPLENDAEKIRGVELVYLSSKEHILKMLRKETVGFDEDTLKARTFLNLHKSHIALKKASSQIKRPREIKDSEEIENIKKAIVISKNVLDNIKFYDRRELDIANKIDGTIKLDGADPAFEAIVSNGSGSIHHLPENTIIKKSRPTIIDFGARYNWYCCDITRSYPGNQRKWKAVWEDVKNIQEQIIDHLRPGVKMGEIQELYKTLMGRKYKVYHSFGHGLGLEVHEQITGELKENMVITVEPGVYLKHLGGIRIEDDILVTKGKPIILTRTL